MARNQSAVRGGFSLVEVLVALALLSVLSVGVAAAAGRVASGAARDAQTLHALDLVRERLARVASDPTYRQLETRYAGVEPDTALAGFQRTTTIARVLETRSGGRTLDYKRVEVQVTGPGVATAVRRSITVAAP